MVHKFNLEYNITEKETFPNAYNHINGTTEETLARVQVAELCRGWPLYRDASEWRNYRELFSEDAFVFTTWSGGLHIDDFIEISKKGRANGDFIMHRENGVLTEVSIPLGRAVGKMKATITQRFKFDNIECDVECDCRFIFFCVMTPQGWKAKWVKLFYERDKVTSVDGHGVPSFSPEELDLYPDGYKYLGAAQGRLGHNMLFDLPTMNNPAFTKLYQAMDDHMQGKEADLHWELKN